MGARRRRRARPTAGAPSGSPPCSLIVLAWAARAEAAYSFRMSITIDRTRIGTSTGATTLSNYPLLLDITSTNLRNTGGRRTRHERQRLRHQLPGRRHDHLRRPVDLHLQLRDRELHLAGASGRVIAWVNIPVLKTAANTADTVIYVKYGDAAVTTPTQNQNGTWNSNFKGVWHLNQAASPQTDSTSTPSNASHNGAPAPATATGLISSGVSMSSTTGTAYLDYRSTKFNWTSSDTFTYQGWFKTTDGAGPLFSQRDNGAGNPDIDITVGYNGATTNTNKMSVLVRDDTGGAYAQVNGSAAVNDNVWHHFAVTRSGGTIEVYVDGASIGTGTDAGARRQHHDRERRATTRTSAARGTGCRRATARPTSSTWRRRSTSSASRTPSAPPSGSRPTTTRRGRRRRPTRWAASRTPPAATAREPARGVRRRQHRQRRRLQQLVHRRVGLHLQHGDAERLLDGLRRRHRRGLRGLRRRRHDQRQRLQRDLHRRDHYHCSGSPSTCTLALFDYYKIDHDRSDEGRNGVAAPTTLSNYPVLFSVTDPALARTTSGGHVRNANGYDIIFRGLDTVTCGGPSVCTLSHQVEKYVPTTGEIVAWVNVPGLKSPDELRQHPVPHHVRQPGDLRRRPSG